MNQKDFILPYLIPHMFIETQISFFFLKNCHFDINMCNKISFTDAGLTMGYMKQVIVNNQNIFFFNYFKISKHKSQRSDMSRSISYWWNC